MPRPDPWILAATAAFSAVLAVVVAFQAVALYREWKVRRDALETLGRDDDGAGESRPQAAVVRNSDDEEGRLLQILGEHFPRLWDLHHVLAQSGLGWSLEGFLARVFGFGLFGALVAALASGRSWMAFVGFFVGAAGPSMYVRWKKKRRILRLESQLPDAIDLIARAVRAGHPLSEGLRMAAEEGSEPLAAEFRITFEEQRFGLPFEEALMGLGDRVEVVDVRILITAILVQREVGGNLSEILEQIAETMRARFNLKRQVRVYTAQGRMSGYTLAALPIVVGSVISLINPPYTQVLFSEPLGKALLSVAAVLQFIGFLWIRRIVDVRY